MQKVNTKRRSPSSLLRPFLSSAESSLFRNGIMQYMTRKDGTKLVSMSRNGTSRLFTTSTGPATPAARKTTPNRAIQK